jgi:hypothetical protein
MFIPRFDLRYIGPAMESEFGGVMPRQKYPVTGLSKVLLHGYAPNSGYFFKGDEADDFIVPTAFYSTHSWCYGDNQLSRGDPFFKILQWILTAIHTPDTWEDKYHWVIPHEEICAYLAALHILGMDEPADQIEVAIKRDVLQRPLTVNEIINIWEYQMGPPNPWPEKLWKIPAGFKDNGVMNLFRWNLETISRPMFEQRHAAGDPSQLTEYNEFVESCPELQRLMKNPNMGSWLRILGRHREGDKNTIIEDWRAQLPAVSLQWMPQIVEITDFDDSADAGLFDDYLEPGFRNP